MNSQSNLLQRGFLRSGWTPLVIMLGALPFLTPSSQGQTFLPSTNDLWDISQGTIITTNSGANAPNSDIRDMFGGLFSALEPGHTVFADGKPPGFVHYVEWQTATPVTVGAIALYGGGDGPANNNQREFAQFVLKAKSSALATNFDLTLYSLVVTNHPYSFVDPADYAHIVTNIVPVTAQYFRAEITQYTSGTGFDGPRVDELDAYPSLTPSINSQPVDKTVVTGGATSFSVQAGGLPAFSYQWQLNGTNISTLSNPTATSSTLLVTNLQGTDSGELYSVSVSNWFGVTNSSNALLTVLTPGACDPPPPGLVSWWPGEHNAFDVAGTNNGTLVGGVTFTNGEVGQAFSFNGTSQYVHIPNASNLNVAGQVTIDCWVYSDPANPIGSRFEGLVTADYYGIEMAPGNNLYFYVSTDGGNSYAQTSDFNPGGLTFPAGQWHHVAATYDGTQTQMYLDGQPVGSPRHISGNISPMHPGSFVALGSENGRSCACGSRYFKGLMDEVDIFNRALSAAEIQNIYYAGSTGKCQKPFVTAQPQSQVDYYGSSIVLSVSAGGTGALSYQWLDNGIAIPDATNSTLMLNSLQFTNAGAYSVVISNPYGTITSAPAILTVNPPGVSIALYSGITITGVPGLTYGIQYSTDLSNTNDWLGLTNVTLVDTNALSFDLQPASLSRRYYRVVPGPISIP